MIRLTAYISGRVQRVGYRAKVVSQALEMGLVGLVQNQPDGRVLVIAEGEKKDDLERFASAIRIENALIRVENIDAEYFQGSGQYSNFKKVTGPGEVGERLDDGIEILKRMLDNQDETREAIRDLTTITKDIATTTKDIATTTKDTSITVKDMTTLTKEGLAKQDEGLGKMDQMIGEIEGLRSDLKSYMDRRFKRIEADLAELKEMKTALKEKGLI